MSKTPIAIFWHRRDLRIDDNAGLYHALKGDYPVLPLFIFDRHILDKLENKKDARVEFIQTELSAINEELKGKGTTVISRYGKPELIWKQLLEEYDVKAVYANRDYEPYALERDEQIKAFLDAKGIAFHTYKDHVIHEPMDVLKDDGNPYKVFTPFSRKWKEALTDEHFESFTSGLMFDNWAEHKHEPIIPLSDMGFEPTEIDIPSKTLTDTVLENYGDQRNYPAKPGTSRLGIHYRFGTISIRKKAQEAKAKSEVYLNELIWREFYQMIMYNYPHVIKGSFREKYDHIDWRNNEEEFEAWCQGKTGYPIVDAGMRELNETGFMHNRVRMIVASFLTKHLLIDWRWGEAYFAEKLLDFELASNNGGWQWASGGGTDAAPYFRIFNPTSQTQKFDKGLRYVRQWVPELDSFDYPKPIVDHKFARERCLETYKATLKND